MQLQKSFRFDGGKTYKNSENAKGGKEEKLD